MRIGIIVAMQKELDHLLKFAGKYRITEVLGNKVYAFENHSEIYAVLSGVGEIQAAMACSILLSIYKVDRIINYGYFGALCTDLQKGEIVNIESVIHYDIDLTIFGMKPGQYNESTKVEFIADDDYFRKLYLAKKETIFE